MNISLTHLIRSGAAALLLALPAFAADKATEEAIDRVNARFLHSSILRIDEQGGVRLRTPDRELRFNIRDAAFNVNDRNGDPRVRIACAEPMASGDPGAPREAERRESFACRSRLGAQEAVEALRQIRRAYLGQDPARHRSDRAVASPDKDVPFARVSEALERLDDLFEISVPIGVDPGGILTIDGPDALYRVDLTRAEFMVNDQGGDPRVRIYGDWCLETRNARGHSVKIARESFTAGSLRAARRAVLVLYTIKAAYTGQDPAKVPAMRAVTGAATRTYATLAQAVDALNDRLAVSVVLGVDAKGVATINAPDAVYRVDLASSEIRPETGAYREKGFFHWITHEHRGPGVLIRSSRGLEREEDGVRARTVDEELFSTETRTGAEEAAKALEFIRGALKGRS